MNLRETWLDQWTLGRQPRTESSAGDRDHFPRDGVRQSLFYEVISCLELGQWVELGKIRWLQVGGIRRDGFLPSTIVVYGIDFLGTRLDRRWRYVESTSTVLDRYGLLYGDP